MPGPSPFFYTQPTATVDSLAILHLKRDSLLPVKLAATADDGYAEGAVTNTRFGSFPHSTLIGLKWGSQVRASKVDTGTRGRKGKKAKQQQLQHAADADAEVDVNAANENGQEDDDDRDVFAGRAGRKRKSDAPQQDALESPAMKKRKQEPSNGHSAAVKAPVEAGSGFIHVLPPTPEQWTWSLDHRTQVVYIPDYSYILQRLRVQPGSIIIEAGAGSGSFTHAASRAIFNGYPVSASNPPASPLNCHRTGRVCSFEYHEPRVHTLRQEITDHGLDGVVQLTHRDVCNDGFSLAGGSSPNADAVFLDLPAPWQALKHLTRSTPNSPLNPDVPIHLCTFSPCIEQVTATVAALRKAGWASIEMVTVQNHRIDVRRERVGLKEEGLRGVNATAANVEESLERLREVENKLLVFNNDRFAVRNTNARVSDRSDLKQEKRSQTKQERLEQIKREAEARKLYKEGRLVHRTEPEVKTHTSYLVFAVLPKAWSEDDERRVQEMYPVGDIMKAPPGKEREREREAQSMKDEKGSK